MQAVQQEVSTVFKSGKRDRISSNSDIFDFELSDADMALITSIRKRLGEKRIAWDPTKIP